MLGFEPADPSGYGRLILDPQGHVAAIREDKDASEAERRIGLCNAGAMAFRVAGIADLLVASATLMPRANTTSPTPSRSLPPTG